MPAALPAAQLAHAAVRRAMLIDGAWRDASDGATFAVHDPATGEQIARVPEATAEDVDAAVLVELHCP